MKAVITIIGSDSIGIVHKATGVLVEYNLNIVDITQTIMQNYFTMIMIVDISKMKGEFEDLINSYDKLGEEIGVVIKVQHEDIFNAMHKI